MSAAPIYVGPGTPELCKRAAEAYAARKADPKIAATLKAVADEVGVSPSTLRRLAGAHKAIRSYEVKLRREGDRELTVCTVITPKGAVTAAKTAVREFGGTLKNLELPGWSLTAGGASFDLMQLRADMAKERRAA